jgi:polyhydroxybutyrate depolymerase
MKAVKKVFVALSAILIWTAIPAVSANAVSIGQTCAKTTLGTRVSIRVSKKPVIVVCRNVAGRKKWIRAAVQTLVTNIASTTTTVPAPVTNYTDVVDPIDPTLHTIAIEGMQPRTYYLNTPPNYAAGTPVPLLIGLHGRTGSASQFAADTGIVGFGQEMGFITLFVDGAFDDPTGIRSWNSGSCCSPAIENNIDDVKLISIIIEKLILDLSIDKTRIWAVGFSNGGMMAYRLACELSSKITAIGVGGGALVNYPCSPTSPVSLIHLHGQLDEVIPIDGGGKFESPNALQAAMLLNKDFNCGNASKTTNQDFGAIHYNWTCLRESEVEFVNYLGAGHGWNLNWTKTILRFLFAHPRK